MKSYILLIILLLNLFTVSVWSKDSGVLIGLRSQKGETDTKRYNYRTLWITQYKGKLSFTEVPDILVPRKTGFWKMGSITEKNYDFLWYTALDKKIPVVVKFYL
jgi:hypothetical protein